MFQVDFVKKMMCYCCVASVPRLADAIPLLSLASILFGSKELREHPLLWNHFFHWIIPVPQNYTRSKGYTWEYSAFSIIFRQSYYNLMLEGWVNPDTCQIQTCLIHPVFDKHFPLPSHMTDWESVWSKLEQDCMLQSSGTTAITIRAAFLSRRVTAFCPRPFCPRSRPSLGWGRWSKGATSSSPHTHSPTRVGLRFWLCWTIKSIKMKTWGWYTKSCAFITLYIFDMLRLLLCCFCPTSCRCNPTFVACFYPLWV